MNQNNLQRAVADTSNVLRPVLDIAYALHSTDKYQIVQVANEVNKKLGYSLFDDLYYPRLVHDFNIVARAVAKNAIPQRQTKEDK